MTTLSEKWSIPLSLGFSVIPVEPNGKKPLGEWKAFMTHPAETDTVARWAANNNCNVGVVTGQVSGGLVVPDFDKPAAEEEAKRRGLPDTMTVRTGRGRHYYFKCPTGRTPRKPKGFPPGMDLQWNGKFVVAPGSVHPDGSVYEWENHPDIYDLADCPEWLLEPMLGAHTGAVGDQDEDEEDDGPLVSIDELRDALSAIPSDERSVWVAMGHALKTLRDDKGKRLWLEWSARSQKFDKADALAKWDSFRPTGTSYKAVFSEAYSHGWKSQKQRERVASQTKDPKRRQRIPLGAMELHPTEFVLDGFIPTGVSVIAGAWGAGKSTNLIPLLASVAHLTPEDWGFWPALRRKVIWVTEAPDQARDTLYSLAHIEGAADWQEFDAWFHLYPALREPAKDLANDVKEWVADAAWTNEVGFQIRPVVVIDTTSANLELENESDNSQVGAAMAALKQTLPGLPLILVGHTPKMNRKSLEDMSFRGAGAWEADAAATFYMVHDEETGIRFMAIRKARFTPTYREIDFGERKGSTVVDTPWGDPQTKSFLHGVPTKSDGSTRKAAKAEAKEAKKEEQKEQGRTEKQESVFAYIRQCAANGTVATKRRIVTEVTGKEELLRGAVDRLVEAGSIHTRWPSKEELRLAGLRTSGQTPEIFLPIEVDFDVFFDSLRSGRQS